MDCKSSISEAINMFKSTMKSCGPKIVVTEINNNDVSSDSESAKSTSPNKYATHAAMTNVAQDFVNDMKISSSNSSFTSALVPQMENLRLSQKSHSHKRLAGYIRAVIPPTGTVVVQLAPGSRILDIGTAIFLQNDKELAGGCNKYDEIGFISDIFGSILEPMYSLQLKEKDTGTSLRINVEVFYLHEHSSTRYISVRRNIENRYTVIHE